MLKKIKKREREKYESGLNRHAFEMNIDITYRYKRLKKRMEKLDAISIVKCPLFKKRYNFLSVGTQTEQLGRTNCEICNTFRENMLSLPLLHLRSQLYFYSTSLSYHYRNISGNFFSIT